MGRPLKISKAQAVITITDVSGTTDLVTTSNNFTDLGIIAGMSFIPHTTTGNLVAGTQYWILQVVNAGSNSTFYASATTLSANPTYTKFDPGTAGPVTNLASVNVVDAYFNNPNSGAGYPATNTATYSVVGGNTSIYGKQVLCSVAIGQSGTGTIYTDTGSADVYGAGTDFANTVSVGSAVQFISQQTGQPVNVGFVSSIGGYITETITDTEATGSFVVTSGDATNFVVDQPITFDGDIGGLTAGDTYFVLSGANTTHFQVSTKLGGTAFPVSNDTVTVDATQDALTLVAVAAANSTFNTNPMASWVYADDEAGYIVRQKGKQKYLVKGGTTGLVAACYTANVANTALTPNTMTITATYANAATIKVQSLSDHTAELFTATSGPVATGNIVLANASPAFGTFNTAYAANTYGGQPYPIVQIGNA
jgi:hypothetical protein